MVRVVVLSDRFTLGVPGDVVEVDEEWCNVRGLVRSGVVAVAAEPDGFDPDSDLVDEEF